jgi:hypothetical protein
MSQTTPLRDSCRQPAHRGARSRSIEALAEVVFITACCAIAFSLGVANAQVPNPVVTPVASTAPPGDPSHAYTFFSTDHDLAGHGYIEEEFFFEGTANRYTTPALQTGSIIDSGHPYKTRMVVRRPADPK